MLLEVTAGSAELKLATSTDMPCLCRDLAIGTTILGIQPRMRTGRFRMLLDFSLTFPGGKKAVGRLIRVFHCAVSLHL